MWLSAHRNWRNLDPFVAGADAPGPFNYRVSVQEILVDLDADAGLVDWPHAAVLADLPGLGAQLVAELVGDREIGFEVAAVVDRRQEMDRDRMVEARHRAVRMD